MSGHEHLEPQWLSGLGQNYNVSHEHSGNRYFSVKENTSLYISLVYEFCRAKWPKADRERERDNDDYTCTSGVKPRNKTEQLSSSYFSSKLIEEAPAWILCSLVGLVQRETPA